MSVLCAPAPFLLLPLWEGCFLYLWVHECSLCSCSISTLSSVGRMFSIPLGSWMFSVLQHHFYLFLCGKDVFCTSGFMSVFCALAAFLPLPLWEGCFLYLWVHECLFSVLQQPFHPHPLWEGCFLYFWVHECSLCSCSISTPILCGKDVFCTSGFMSVCLFSVLQQEKHYKNYRI